MLDGSRHSVALQRVTVAGGACNRYFCLAHRHQHRLAHRAPARDLAGRAILEAAIRCRRRHWLVVGVGALLAFIFAQPIAVAIVAATVVMHIGGSSAVAIYAATSNVVLVAINIGPRLYLMARAIMINDSVKAIRGAWLRGRRNTQRPSFGSLLVDRCCRPCSSLVGSNIAAMRHGLETLADWSAQLDPASHVALGFTQAVAHLIISPSA